VGYFFAFDIAWFPLFSFSEHLVLAIRALPIAIGASVGFLIAPRFSKDEPRWEGWLHGRGFHTLWMYILAGIAAVAFLVYNHLGLAASLFAVAGGTA
jgi:hypothetical protein